MYGKLVHANIPHQLRMMTLLIYHVVYVMRSREISRNLHVTFSVFYLIKVLICRGSFC